MYYISTKQPKYDKWFYQLYLLNYISRKNCYTFALLIHAKLITSSPTPTATTSIATVCCWWKMLMRAFNHFWSVFGPWRVYHTIYLNRYFAYEIYLNAFACALLYKRLWHFDEVALTNWGVIALVVYIFVNFSHFTPLLSNKRIALHKTIGIYIIFSFFKPIFTI